MGQHLLSPPERGFTDKFRSRSNDGDLHAPVKTLGGLALFTANGAGTTTTLVGAAASLTASTNCARIGEKFMLATSAGVLKENTVFTVTAHNGTTTITFTPAAAAATANGDQAILVANDPFESNNALDARLLSAGGVYTQAYVDKMTQNDKVYAVRQLDLAESVK